MTSQAVTTSDLADLRRRFRQWRANHPKRYIPKVLWQHAARCAQYANAKEVARAIDVKLSYLHRKIRQYGAEASQPLQDDVFVELALPLANEATNSPSPVPICCKLEDGSGRSATMQFEGQLEDLLPVLGPFFREAN